MGYDGSTIGRILYKYKLFHRFLKFQIILELFEDATRKLATDFLPTLSTILPILTSLITSLENQSTDLPLVKKIKDTLRVGLEDRFKNVYEDKLVRRQ